LERRLAGSQSWSGHREEESSLVLLPGIESRFLGHPACSQFIMVVAQSLFSLMMMMCNELLDLDVSDIVTFDILTAVAIKNAVFWDVTLRWLEVGVYRRFRIHET
jgi:hypothetical protein